MNAHIIIAVKAFNRKGRLVKLWQGNTGSGLTFGIAVHGVCEM